MTVSNQTNRIAAVGNAAIGQEVPFPFSINATSDLLVKKRVIATGVETLLYETTNYTVEINGDIGGTLTTVTAIEVTEQIHLIGNPSFTQSLDLEQGGSFSAENIEDALDKNTTLSIVNKDKITYKAITFPETDAAALTTELPSSIDGASKVVARDSSGNITMIDAVPEGSVAFSTFGTNMAETANATSARTLLELGWFDIRAYGAGTGESAATNATAIQAAFTAAQAVGGTVFGSPGEYLIDTALDVTNSITIWMPGVTIKQDDGANQTYVLKIDVASSKDVSLFIKVDGNMDNNTAIEGIVLNGIKLSHGLINVTALECDTGIVVEGNTEANTIFLKGISCGVGVLERADGALTPDENILFVSGHSNATHYKKESSGIQITSVLHFACEQATAYAVIIDGGFTIINGELRGCQDGGIDLISGSALFNNPMLYGADAEWALRITTGDDLHGSLRSVNFDGGVWIKESNNGSLYINCGSCFSKPGIKLGDKSGGNTLTKRFTILPGSYVSSTTGPAVEFDYSRNCEVNLSSISTGAGDDVLFDAESDNDTLVIPVILNDITPNVHATAANPTIKLIGYGTPPSFADVDATPSILMGNYFLSGTAGETITDFTDKAAGKEFTIISKAAIVYDTTGTNLVGSSTDITTASGDVTKWICEDDTTVRLLNFIDVSQDNSSAAEGIYGQ